MNERAPVVASANRRAIPVPTMAGPPVGLGSLVDDRTSRAACQLGENKEDIGLETEIVNANIPLLLGGAALERMGAILDFQEMKLKFGSNVGPC